jgi:hypothetical protein
MDCPSTLSATVASIEQLQLVHRRQLAGRAPHAIGSPPLAREVARALMAQGLLATSTKVDTATNERPSVGSGKPSFGHWIVTLRPMRRRTGRFRLDP